MVSLASRDLLQVVSSSLLSAVPCLLRLQLIVEPRCGSLSGWCCTLECCHGALGVGVDRCEDKREECCKSVFGGGFAEQVDALTFVIRLLSHPDAGLQGTIVQTTCHLVLQGGRLKWHVTEGQFPHRIP